MGCESPTPQPISVDQSLAARQQDDSAYDPIVARVSGEPIRKSEVAQILWQGRGRKVLNELIALETVRQRARRVPIAAWEDLTAQEWNRILQNMAPGKLRREQMALLEYMLQSRGITHAEFDLIVQRQALLRRMARVRTSARSKSGGPSAAGEQSATNRAGPKTPGGGRKFHRSGGADVGR